MSDNTESMSPSQRIIAEASAPTVITDALGRKLTLRTITALDQLKLYRAIGADHSMNQQVYWLSAAAAGCSHVDGVYFKFPSDEKAIDARMKILGNDGLNAIINHHRELVTKSAAAARKAAAEARALLGEGEEGDVEEADPDPLA